MSEETQSPENTNNEFKPDQIEMPLTQESESIQSKEEPVKLEPNKSISDDGEEDLSSIQAKKIGLSKSLLKPLSDKDAKMVKNYNNPESPRNGNAKKFLLALGFVICLSLLFIVINTIRHNKIAVFRQTSMKEATILNKDVVAFEDSLRITLKTSPVVDLTVVLINNTRYKGTMLAEDEKGIKFWEFMISDLKPGTYDYKAFAKNTSTNKFDESLGNITIIY